MSTKSEDSSGHPLRHDETGDKGGMLLCVSCSVMSDSYVTQWTLPGSSVHGILQARILEWVAIPFSRDSSWPRDRTRVSCIAGRFFTESVSQFSSVAQSCPTLCNSRDCSTPGFPGAYSNSCLSCQWYHPTISYSVVLFSSCVQSFPASESFPMSQFFASGSQSIGVSASASVLPKNIQDWFPLGWTGWISLQSKGLSKVFSNTTAQKHQFFYWVRDAIASLS